MPVLFKDRRRGFLEVHDFILLVDHEGNEAFFKVGRDEPMLLMRLQFGSATVSVAATTGTTGYVQVPPLAPARENRLYQVRPFIYAEDRVTGLRVPDVEVPSGVELQVEHPSGTRRYGSDESRDITFNAVANTGFGGPNAGVVSREVGPFRDERGEIYDLFTVYGAVPAFQVQNRSPVVIGGANDNRNWFLGFIARKYLLLDVTKEEEQKLLNRMLEYRGISIGGVPLVTTRA